MFASSVKKTLELKSDDGTSTPVVIRKLSAKSLSKAREIATAAQSNSLRVLGPELVQAYATIGTKPGEEEPADPKKEARKKYASYDRDYCLTAGILSIFGVESTELSQRISDLDEETATIIHQEIVDLSVASAEKLQEESAKG